MSTKMSSMPMMIEPRLAGDRKPMAANRISRKVQMISCMPVPASTQKSMGKSTGGRNTSACTSFQPLSSLSSAFSSSVGSCV